MENFIATETLIIELMVIVSLVAIVVRRLRIPYTVALVIVGLLITFQQKLQLNLTPELILWLFVPPLLFEAAFHIEFKSLRENWLPIMALAIPGVLISTFLVGTIVSFGLNIPFAVALVFGALISATDPVAVVALFKALGAPKRLTTLVESESLFNDGTAIVIFRIMVAGAVTMVVGVGDTPTHGGDGASTFSLLTAGVDFIRVAAGGVLIGGGLGWITAKIIERVDDYLIETTLTTVLAFGSFLVAEEFHVSGVLAVVVAGIVTGNIGTKKMSPTTKIVLYNFWEYLAFIANSLVFLLIGLDVNIRELSSNLLPIGIALAAVLLSRALVVYGLIAITNLRGAKLSSAYKHVLYWGGLRGAISLALALSLPAAIAERELLRAMTFGVVLFTLLVQGTTMQFLMKRLGIGVAPALELEYERRHGRLLAAQAAFRCVSKMQEENMLSITSWNEIEPQLRKQVVEALDAQTSLLEKHPELQSEELDDAQMESLRAQRAALVTMFSNGVISENVYEELIEEVDGAIAQAHRDTHTRDAEPITV